MSNKCSDSGPRNAELRRIAATVAAVIDALIGLLREHADAPHGVGLWYQTGAAPVIDRLLALRAELDAIRYLGRDPPPRDRGAG